MVCVIGELLVVQITYYEKMLEVQSLSSIKKIKKSLKGVLKKNSAILIVDSSTVNPNIVIEKISNVKDVIDDLGRIIATKFYIEGNRYSDELIDRIVEIGGMPIIEPSDLDIHLALALAELIYDKNINIIIIATKNVNFVPILIKAKSEGKKTILIKEDSTSNPLDNTVDSVVNLSEI